jgi:hypothetical protein
MSRLMTHDRNVHGLVHDDAYRLYPAARTAASADYRFGSLSGKRGRVRARRALTRVTGYFKMMIEEIADAKLRRMERELELSGIRSGRMVARNPGRSNEN